MGPERRLRLFIYARILVTFLILASTVILNLNEPRASDDPAYVGLIRLVVFSFLFSVCSHYFVKLPRFRNFVTYLQTIWDLLFVTVLLLFTGGVTSPYSFLYLLSIMSAGVMLGRREAIYTASLCGILYGAIIDFQYFGLLLPLGLDRTPALQMGSLRLVYNIFLNLLGFYLAAFITGYLSAVAKESEDALLAKSIDYTELERLSSAIVSNAETGLLTITPEGRIRVFNRYAEELTGKSLADVYDQPLKDVFPVMAVWIQNSTGITEGECIVQSPGGDKILGYSSVPFTGSKGENAGTILNFKDLTAIKQMELALKRRDSLAILGELSARMAHEIRNPLAAMSGSVQLLAEHGSIDSGDRRLLSIILREADRLNVLINEFLEYARPASPCKEAIDLRELVEDMRLFLASDQRFSGMVIANQVPPRFIVHADANQLRQVLLNLLHNSAEASTQDGVVEIGATLQKGGIEGDEDKFFTIITVTDNGTGLSDEAILHLFEPFWTTKPQGTGLGLAIIYRIIEGHGGYIKAESPTDGGCLFTIALPD